MTNVATSMKRIIMYLSLYLKITTSLYMMSVAKVKNHDMPVQNWRKYIVRAGVIAL